MRNLFIAITLLGMGACASETPFQPALDSTEQGVYWVCCGSGYVCANESGCSYNQCAGIPMGDWCAGDETWHTMGEFEVLESDDWIPPCTGMYDICDW